MTIRAWAIAATVFLALAGSSARAQTQGVSDNAIVIGTYTDLSGVAVAWGVNNSNAYRMAFDAQNAAGGINGRQIEYVVEDNQYQVPRSVQAANKLLNHDDVFLMVANAGTPMNNAVLPTQLERNVPNIFPLTSARSMYEPFNRLKFGLASSYYDQMRSGVKYFVADKGRKTVCALYQDTDFGRDVMAGVHDQMTAMGLKLAAETSHRPTDTDFTASVARLRDANCDLLILGSIVRDTGQIIAAVRKSGWDVDMMGPVSIYDEAIAALPGGASEGLYAVTPVLFANPDDPRPAVQAFVRKYKELYGKDPNFAAQIGYTGAQLLILGLQNAGRNLTVDSFIAGMESIKDFHDIFGSPPMSFGPDRRQGSSQSFLAQIHGGRWTAVSMQPLGY